MSESHKFLELESRDNAVDVAVQIISAELDLAVAKYGSASCVVSGGSSPKPILEALSEIDIAWGSIGIGLVDERWVPDGASGSNAGFLRQTLLNNYAAQAGFLPMTTEDSSAAEGLAEVHQRYLNLRHPFDVAVMGMGTDGHTASWFSGSDGLSAALDLNTAGLVSAVNAKGCSGAGDYPDRVTLTRAALLPTRTMILFIPGAQKRKVFEAAIEGDIVDYPVKALLDLGSRLTVIWAP